MVLWWRLGGDDGLRFLGGGSLGGGGGLGDGGLRAWAVVGA